MADMPRPALPHLHHERNRHGVMAYYVRVGKGQRTRIRGACGGAEFMAAYDAAINGKTPPKAGAGPAQGTFSWGLALYRGSQAWQSLAPGHFPRSAGATRTAAE